jgi:uncharacterized protein YndB with AHSA1/START domain
VISDSIERDVLIEAPVDVVWSVITEPAKITRWFSDLAELDLRPGGAGTLTWVEHDHVAPLVVEAIDAPHRFAFRWVHPEGETPREGNSTLVEFTVAAEGDGRTRLRVVESGLDALDWDPERKAEFRDDHDRGWQQNLGDLVAYLSARAEAVPATAPR